MSEYWRWLLARVGQDTGSADEYARAMALAGLARAEESVAALRAGIRIHRSLRQSDDVGRFGIYVVLGVDPRFDPLRNTPGFASVLDSVGIPVAARRPPAKHQRATTGARRQ
jgi:hypothetical protein